MINHLLHWPSRIFGLDQQKLSPAVKILLFIGILMLCTSLMRSVFDYTNYNSTDLRIRIVGARAMARNINPYQLDYSPELPETLQDPDQYVKGLSRCPYPPSLLLLYMPLSIFPYPLARIFSMVLEWSAMITIIAISARMLPTHKYYRIGFIIISLIGFAGSYFWRLHVERGQYSIFILFFLSFGIYQLLESHRENLKSGVSFGLAFSIHPPVVVILFFLAIQKQYRTVIYSLATAVLIGLFTLPFGGTGLWRDWNRLVHRYEDNEAGIPLKNVSIIKERYPAEGFQPGKSLPSLTENSSTLAILIKVQNAFGFAASPQVNKRLAKISTASLALFLSLLFVWANYQKKFESKFGWLFAVMVTMVLGFITPVRFGYVNVQFMLLFALGLPYIVRPRAVLVAAVTIFGLFSKASGILQTVSMILPFVLILTVSVINRIFESYRRKPSE